MKRLAITSAWFFIVAYCALTMTLGPSGLLATRRAEKSARLMSDNLESLARRNAALSEEWKAFTEGWEEAALEARSLGYLGDDEVAVRLSVGRQERVPGRPGEILFYEQPVALEDIRCKELAAALAALWFLGGLASKALRRKGPQRAILAQDASRT